MRIFSKLFGQKKESCDSSMTAELAEKIIKAYGAVLETQAPSLGCVADVSKLPFPKQQIKKALQIFLIANKNDPYMRKQITFAYIALSSWQEGVGDKNVGIDLTNVDINDDPMKLADLISKQGCGYENWEPIVQAEQEALMKELQALDKMACHFDKLKAGQ